VNQLLIKVFARAALWTPRGPDESNQCGIRNQLDVTWCYNYFLFISCSTYFGQPCAHPQELTTQWFYRRVWFSPVAAVGCQNRLAGCVSIEEYVAQCATYSSIDTGFPKLVEQLIKRK